ncbi:MAG: ribulose-phosphate 3-epimerase [Euryarchaeota archaeon]|nr:ribulose-phosphate 3-epimerase [Euryarchaeota archaeon]
MVKIAPSILSADFSRLGKEVQEAERGGADMVHVDVMDGHFVPNLTIGPVVVKAIAPLVNIPIDIHLMVEDPQRCIEGFVRALERRDISKDYITVHVESCTHLHRVVGMIKERGLNAGVALNPATPLNAVSNVLGDIDLLVIMTVNPGFSGQSFIESMIPKIKKAKELAKGRNIDILVDGGVKVYNARKIVEAGAAILAAGSAVFNKNDSIENNIRRIREVVSGE